MAAIIKLEGKAQNYAWGGSDFIPALIGFKKEENLPYAEWWMGTHPRGAAQLDVDGEIIGLADYIASSPESILGTKTAAYFDNQLPLLFKVLDVKSMLSIQVHPTKEEAIAGFKKENAAGIALDAFNRNFKDNNHKPELMVALSDFWLLHGFKSYDQILSDLKKEPALKAFYTLAEQQKDLKALYEYVMRAAQEEVDALLQPLFDKVKVGSYDENNPHYWAKDAFEIYTREEHYDRGIFSIYMMHLLYLKEGEAIFQDAGILHAYLKGQNIEIMANSDNVFRGGLTPKYVDVDELLNHVKFEGIEPKVISNDGNSTQETVFKTPAPDFELSEIVVKKDLPYEIKAGKGAAIFLIYSGRVTVDGKEYTQGQSFFATDISEATIKGEAVLFRAGVGSL